MVGRVDSVRALANSEVDASSVAPFKAHTAFGVLRNLGNAHENLNSTYERNMFLLPLVSELHQEPFCSTDKCQFFAGPSRLGTCLGAVKALEDSAHALHAGGSLLMTFDF